MRGCFMGSLLRAENSSCIEFCNSSIQGLLEEVQKLRQQLQIAEARLRAHGLFTADLYTELNIDCTPLCADTSMRNEIPEAGCKHFTHCEEKVEVSVRGLKDRHHRNGGTTFKAKQELENSRFVVNQTEQSKPAADGLSNQANRTQPDGTIGDEGEAGDNKKKRKRKKGEVKEGWTCRKEHIALKVMYLGDR